jgi:ATP-dependent helicase/nuclease subunit A
MRVLYVAMTRARERLILVGTGSLARIDSLLGRYRGCDGPLPLTQLQTADYLLDWVLAALCAQDAGRLIISGIQDDTPERNASPATALFDLKAYSADAMTKWRIDPPPRKEILDRLSLCARLAEIEAPVPDAEVARTVALLERRLTATYPHDPLTRVPAVTAASELKRRWDSSDLDSDGPAGAWNARHPSSFSHRFLPPAFISTADRADPTGSGTRAHAFLEQLDFQRPCTADDLRAQLDALTAAGRMTSSEARDVPLDDIAWFFQSELGRRLRAAPRRHREWPFVIGVDPSHYDRNAQSTDPADLLLVRGVVDCLFDAGDGWEIVDYKTDRVTGASLDERAALYRGQLALYAEAAAGILRSPVRRRWLVFLAPRQIVEV